MILKCFYSFTRYGGTVDAPQIICVKESPSIFLLNCLERFKHISAKAGTTTKTVGLNICKSLKIACLSLLKNIILPVYKLVSKFLINIKNKTLQNDCNLVLNKEYVRNNMSNNCIYNNKNNNIINNNFRSNNFFS